MTDSVPVKIRVSGHPDLHQPKLFTVTFPATNTVDDVARKLKNHPVLRGLILVIVFAGRRWSADRPDTRVIGKLRGVVALVSCSKPIDIINASASVHNPSFSTLAEPPNESSAAAPSSISSTARGSVSAFPAVCPLGAPRLPLGTLDRLCAKWHAASTCVAWTETGPCDASVSRGWYCGKHTIHTDSAVPWTEETLRAAAEPTAASVVPTFLADADDDVAPEGTPQTLEKAAGGGTSFGSAASGLVSPRSGSAVVPCCFPGCSGDVDAGERYCARCLEWRPRMFPVRVPVAAAAVDPRTKLPIVHIVRLSPADEIDRSAVRQLTTAGPVVKCAIAEVRHAKQLYPAYKTHTGEMLKITARAAPTVRLVSRAATIAAAAAASLPPAPTTMPVAPAHSAMTDAPAAVETAPATPATVVPASRGASSAALTRGGSHGTSGVVVLDTEVDLARSSGSSDAAGDEVRSVASFSDGDAAPGAAGVEDGAAAEPDAEVPRVSMLASRRTATHGSDGTEWRETFRQDLTASFDLPARRGERPAMGSGALGSGATSMDDGAHTDRDMLTPVPMLADLSPAMECARKHMATKKALLAALDSALTAVAASQSDLSCAGATTASAPVPVPGSVPSAFGGCARDGVALVGVSAQSSACNATGLVVDAGASVAGSTPVPVGGASVVEFSTPEPMARVVPSSAPSAFSMQRPSLSGTSLGINHTTAPATRANARRLSLASACALAPLPATPMDGAFSPIVWAPCVDMPDASLSPVTSNGLQTFPPLDTTADFVSPTARHLRAAKMSQHWASCRRCSTLGVEHSVGGSCPQENACGQ